MEMKKINTRTETIKEKRKTLDIVFQIGATILITGILCFFGAEVWYVIITKGYVFAPAYSTQMVMFFISDAMGIVLAILFMIWINVKDSKKEKALNHVILGFLLYIFTYSLSLSFLPAFFEESFSFLGPISYNFNSYGLNFLGLIFNMVLSLGLFIFLLIANKRTQMKNISKILTAFCLFIFAIINVTMYNIVRGVMMAYTTIPFYIYWEQSNVIFLDQIVELILFILLFLSIISSTFSKNKKLKEILKQGLFFLVSACYLVFSAVNGIDFTEGGSYILISLGKLLIDIGAPIALIASLIAITKEAKDPLILKTEEIVIATPTPVANIETKKQKTTLDKAEPIVEEVTEEIEEEQDTFVETEGYDELFETGLFHIRNNEFDRAIEYWERCVKAKPDFLPGWNNLGLAYKDLEQIDKAIACWSKALEIDPNYAEAAHNLEVALLLKRKRRK